MRSPRHPHPKRHRGLAILDRMWLELYHLTFLGGGQHAASLRIAWEMAAAMDKPAAALTAEDLGLSSLREEEEILDGEHRAWPHMQARPGSTG